MPRSVTVAPPSSETVPPSVAVVSVTAEKVGEVTVGAVGAGSVVNELFAEYDVPWELIA